MIIIAQSPSPIPNLFVMLTCMPPSDSLEENFLVGKDGPVGIPVVLGTLGPHEFSL
jgi:hypothetical protein